MLTAAEVDQYRVIDTDTHVIEPYDLWTSRLPARWRDQAPHVKWDENRQRTFARSRDEMTLSRGGKGARNSGNHNSKKAGNS